ncbi:MAG: hypothetical protein JWM10_4570, partial [Myxococcaceae bacterium]|nr:hypothetical protein [Myxococcaceae bacterium]
VDVVGRSPSGEAVTCGRGRSLPVGRGRHLRTWSVAPRYYDAVGVSAVSRASYFRAAFSSPMARAALSAARTSVRRSP